MYSNGGTVEFKVCIKCSENKGLEEFAPSYYKGGRINTCRKCSYLFYHKKSYQKKLRASGGLPRAEKLKTEEEKRETRNKRRQIVAEKRKASYIPKPRKGPRLPEGEAKRRKNKRSRDYQKGNPKAKETQRLYHQRVKNNPEVKIRKSLRARLRLVLNGTWKMGKTAESIGCALPELRSYLESLFQHGMTWDNYGQWHIDHIKPVCAFDLEDPKEIEKVNHYSNLRPLWAYENCAKSAQDKLQKFKK